MKELSRLEILRLAREELYSKAEREANKYADFQRDYRAIVALRIAGIHENIEYIDAEIKKELDDHPELRDEDD